MAVDMQKQWAELDAKTGFSFENYERNLKLVKDKVRTDYLGGFEKFKKLKMIQTPKTQKTGTTLAGCTFEGGVVMGADTRATSGDTIAEKRCFKVHRITVSLFFISRISSFFV